MSEVEAARRRQGTLYGVGAYLIWGVFPFYFATLRPAGPWEILSHRIVWTLVVCALLLLLTRDVRWLADLARHPRRLGAVALAGLLIAGNWGIYTHAVLTGHVTEAALGYFLNPLVTVALGVLVLRERLRRLQWVAVAIGALAGVYLTVDYGSPPWISFALALTFAVYGLLKNKLGVSLTPLRSLTGETLTVLPLAVLILLWVARARATTYGDGALHTALLTSTGVVTAIPLLLFAAAAGRVPLTTIGLLQFFAPCLQLATGLAMGETMPLSRWLGFGLVWLALVVLSVDLVRQVNRGRRRRRAEAAGQPT